MNFYLLLLLLTNLLSKYIIMMTITGKMLFSKIPELIC